MMRRIRVRRHHAPLLVILLLRVVASVSYTATFPQWETLDELNHYRYAEFIVANNRLPTVDDYPPLPEDIQNLVQYNQPPLFYLTAAAIMRLGGIREEQVLPVPATPAECIAGPEHFFLAGTTPPATSYALLLARVANGMTGLLAVFVTWHATFTLWRDRRLANAAALILALSPPAVALTAWVNNDQLMILLGAALLTASAASPSPKSYGTLVGVSLLATMTKLTGIVALPFSALVILAYEFRRGTRRVLPALAGVFVVAGAYIAWNYANCGLPLCRIYRREHYFEGWISFFYYLGRPPYGESLIQLARTSTIPIIHNTILPETWVVFGGMTVFLIGLCGVGIHWIANRRQSRLGGLLLLIGLALALVWVRIWWFPWSAFLPARYLSLIFAAIAILSARGWLSLGDLLPYRWRWWPLLIPIGWLGWTLISTPTLYYTPMTTPQLATSPSEHLIEAELGGINVVGYTLTQTDDYTRISLNLHSPTPTNIPLYAFVLLQNEVGIPIDTCGQVLGTAAYPSSLWQPDAIVRQTFDFMPVDDPTALEVQLYEIQQLNDLQSTYDPTRQVGTVKIPLRLLSE